MRAKIPGFADHGSIQLPAFNKQQEDVETPRREGTLGENEVMNLLVNTIRLYIP
jgi:hypothetical protein